MKSVAVFFLSSLLLLSATTTTTTAQEQQPEVLTVHGSGTTNPSKCYWHVMDKLQARSKIPIHMTYRAIGSSNGQAEFRAAVNDFASGDIPLTREIYDETTANGTVVLQLPVFVGAVSFFHSVPNTPTLNLTACTLAKIMSRTIVDWGDSEIRSLNPEMNLASGGLPIRVARRVDGSSSTSGITDYLNSACPDLWPADLVGSSIEWNQDTLECEGSGGVTNCIREQPGGIGYIDAGHGHNAGLEEVYLENEAGTKLTTITARSRGGIAGAADVPNLLPGSASEDFSDVTLINQPGQFTWPISAMTYIYVKQDLSFIPEAQSRYLLKAFLEALYNDDYVQQCIDAYEFAKVDGTALQIALDAIDSLRLGTRGTPFTFESEDDTLLIEGQNRYMISAKRQTAAEVEFDRLGVANAQLEERVVSLETALEEALQTLRRMDQNSAGGTTSNGDNGGGNSSPQQQQQQQQNAAPVTDEDTQDAEIAAALAMSIISIILCVVLLLGALWRYCAGDHTTERKAEVESGNGHVAGAIH